MNGLISILVAALGLADAKQQDTDTVPTPRVVQVEWTVQKAQPKAASAKTLKAREVPKQNPLTLWVLPDGTEVVSHAKPIQLRGELEETPE